MSNPGKIARLPSAIRDQVNERLDQTQNPDAILAWLNSHPDVQPFISDHFQGHPISKQNLSQYKTHSFRAWKLRRDAVDFSQTLSADRAGLESPDAETITDSLAQWLGIRYLALAQAAANTPARDPVAELKRLRQLSREILALRRSERLATRGKLARERHQLFRAMAVHGKKLPDETQPPPALEIYPTSMDLLRYQVFGEAVLPQLDHPQYDHPECLI